MQIARADIDNLVYELYGLTPEEIKMVEPNDCDPASSEEVEGAPAVPKNGTAASWPQAHRGKIAKLTSQTPRLICFNKS